MQEFGELVQCCKGGDCHENLCKKWTRLDELLIPFDFISGDKG